MVEVLVISQSSAAEAGQASSRTIKVRGRAHFTGVIQVFEADLYTRRGAAGRRVRSYIRSRVEIPRRSSPILRARAVRSHNRSREPRVAGSALRTGQVS